MIIINLIIFLLIILLIWNYLIPYLLVKLTNDQNLKLKYQNCKWAIITGGSQGIGKEICERLLKQEISIIIVSSNENENIIELKSKYNNSTTKVKSIILDLRKKESCFELINQIEQDKDIEKDKLKLLFNNVGYLTMEGFNQINYDEIFKMLQCNFLTSVELTNYFYKNLLKYNNSSNNNNNGAILFTSSITGLCPTPFSTIYASGKSFLTCFAKSLSIESRYYGIDVLVVQPGLVNTSLFNTVKPHTILKILRLIGQEPSEIVDIMFRGVGNKFGYILFNSGLFSIISDLCISILGTNIMINIVYFISNYILKDFNCYKINKNKIN